MKTITVPANTETVIIETVSIEKITINVGANARVWYIPVMIGAIKTSHHLWLERGATATIRSLVLGGNLTQEIVCHHQGQQAQSSHQGIFLGHEHDRFVLNYWNEHTAEQTAGHILIHGVLFDYAYADFKGNIKIMPTASETDASLTEATLLLGDHARSDSIPQLDIRTNDVRVTHSSSITKLDDEQLFYLSSRGLSEVAAKHLIVTGFLTALIDDVPDATVKNQVAKQIETYLYA